jgi:hypothetical protein
VNTIPRQCERLKFPNRRAAPATGYPQRRGSPDPASTAATAHAIFDPLFSDYSYGFRPGRSAHQAVETARSHVAAGHRWCVELDLEKFFDRVNHDILMAALSAASKTSECSGSSAVTLKLGSCRAVSSAHGRRDAARRPALAVAVEHPARRTRPRAGTAGSSLRALCR